jgi:hypothetical protein
VSGKEWQTEENCEKDEDVEDKRHRVWKRERLREGGREMEGV